MPNERVIAIIPAFNESGNIARTVSDVKRHASAIDIVVIDDGSSDATAAEASGAGAIVLRLPFNLGIGGAVQTGLKYAFNHHYQYALQIDGDGQHDAAYIKDILTPLMAGQGDMIIGSRFLKANEGFQSSFSRRIGINFFVHLINALIGITIKDPTSGFRAFNAKAIALFAQDYPTDFPEPEAIVIAHRSGITIQEIPVQMRQREAGHSSIRHLKTMYYMFKVTLAILLLMLRKPRSIA